MGFIDRKSTRLNSSHLVISYAVFCLKKKKEVLHATRRACRHSELRPQDVLSMRQCTQNSASYDPSVNANPNITPTFFFFFNDTATTEIYTLSLHDALPI